MGNAQRQFATIEFIHQVTDILDTSADKVDFRLYRAAASGRISQDRFLKGLVTITSIMEFIDGFM